MAPIRQGQRIQRSRRKAARLPEGAIYVGRPTIWGTLAALCAASALIAGCAALGAWHAAHWCARALTSLYAAMML